MAVSETPNAKTGNVRRRAMRGSAFTLLNIGATNMLRLGSNLILTRILFPEAFGLMALVQVFLGGLKMFSDIGIKTSILQSKRGDDRNFLNMAWTVQILRGVLLWLVACAMAGPLARLYEEPLLAQILPVMGFGAVISGMMTTNMHTANRHLQLGRQTMVELGCQVVGICVTVALAVWLQSVWALVWGGLFAAVLSTTVMGFALPGIKNRLHWELSAFWELIGFGQYIFFATIAGFLINQGDRAILGGYITTAELGVYSIGFLLGTIPFTLAKTLSNKIVLPLYRMRPPAESATNRRALLKARRIVVAGVLGVAMTLAYVSVPLVDALYDARYALAGPIVCLFSLAMVPQLAFSGYDAALLSNGDSRRFFFLMAITATVQTVLLFVGVSQFGIAGAICAPPVAALLAYPVRVAFVGRYKANDGVGDVFFLLVGGAVGGLACWLWWDDVVKLFG